MKRADLIKRIGRAAANRDLVWEFVPNQGPHEKWVLDGKPVSIPRHREINEHTAIGIMKYYEDKLGVGWWK